MIVRKGMKVSFLRNGEVMTGYILSEQKIADYYAVDEDPMDPMCHHWLVSEKEFITTTTGNVSKEDPQKENITTNQKSKGKKKFKNNIVEVIS